MGKHAGRYRIRTRNEEAIGEGKPAVSLREFAAYWRDAVAAVTAEATQKIRASHLRVHILPALGHLTVQEVNHRLVQEFINSLYEKLSDKSVKNTWATLRSLLAAAEAEELLRRIPNPRLRKVLSREQPRFTAEEIGAIIEAAPDRELQALFGVLAETGCRIEEALELERADLVRPGMLRIRGTKTASARRDLSISGGLRERLRQLGEGRLFRKRQTYYRTRFQDVLQYLGLAVRAKAPFHAMRRANKSLMRRLGVPREIAMYRLGHRRGNVHDAYDQVEPGEDHEWAERMAAEIYGSAPERLPDVEHRAREIVDHTACEGARTGHEGAGSQHQYRHPLLIAVKS